MIAVIDTMIVGAIAGIVSLAIGATRVARGSDRRVHRRIRCSFVGMVTAVSQRCAPDAGRTPLG
jgi:hypothetical protein